MLELLSRLSTLHNMTCCQAVHPMYMHDMIVHIVAFALQGHAAQNLVVPSLA
jgi:hypothetical protein